MAGIGRPYDKYRPAGMHTSSEVAKKVGKDDSTIRRWSKAGLLPAAYIRVCGKVTVRFYSDADLKVAQRLASTWWK